MKCDSCQSDSIIFVRYSGAHLCGKHLTDYVNSRVKKAIREQFDLKGGAKLMFAISGGKDSLAVLHSVHSILSVRPDVEFHAVTIDEGIDGYRPSSVELSKQVTKELGIPLTVLSYSDQFGSSLDSMVSASDKFPCTICGVLRRKLMNEAARDWGADYLVTGLNLDDTAQTILMNIARGDVDRLFRMSPHRNRIEGLVPRVQPFLRIPEKEIYLYAIVNGLPIHGQECPYAEMAERLRYRETVSLLEDASPGSRHGLLRSLESIREFRESAPLELPLCSKCSEPSSSEICSVCKVLDSI